MSEVTWPVRGRAEIRTLGHSVAVLLPASPGSIPGHGPEVARKEATASRESGQSLPTAAFGGLRPTSKFFVS